MRARDVLFSGFSVCYVGMCGVGYPGHSNAAKNKVVVTKMVFNQVYPYSN